MGRAAENSNVKIALIKASSSFLIMVPVLWGYISNSMASLMSQSVYLVFTERSFVSCSLIIWSWLMLCFATADLSVCASRMCLLCAGE
jgi:hypothetical protein